MENDFAEYDLPPERVPTAIEIQEAIAKCTQMSDEGRTDFPRLTFEQGVEAALHWLAGRTTNPVHTG